MSVSRYRQVEDKCRSLHVIHAAVVGQPSFPI